MNHDANDSTVSASLSKKENFEISWHIAEWIEKEKKGVLQIYWSKVKEILDSRIREHRPIGQMGHAYIGTDAGLRSEPLAIPNHFTPVRQRPGLGSSMLHDHDR